MTPDVFLFGILVATAAALADWRLGIRLVILVGMLQDPLRKLVPGTPAIMAISALPVWLALCASLYQRDRQAWPRFERAYPRLSRRMGWFLLSLVPPVLLVFGYGLGAWRMAVLGGFAYLAPLITMVIGFNFAESEGEVRRLLTFYAVAAGLMLVGSPLESLELAPGWLAVGTEALGAVWVRYPEYGGQPFPLISGFFRSPDIMGWHAAMLVVVSVTLGLTSRRPLGRAWLALAVWGGFSLIVAGRRKMIVMPAIWLGFLLWAHLRARRRRGFMALGVATAAVAAALYLALGEGGVIQADYYTYAARTISDAPARFVGGSVGGVWFSVLQSGVLGRGIGSATQGAQHLGGGLVQSWQESGLAKLAVELGLPGLLCGLALAVAVARACHAALARVPLGVPGGSLQATLVGILLANAASFLVSHQAFGDLLIATLTAFLVGVALSAPRWAKLSIGPDAHSTGAILRAGGPRPQRA